MLHCVPIEKEPLAACTLRAIS